MRIAVTGATGFVGRYIVQYLTSQGHSCRCWYRSNSDRGGFDHSEDRLEWVRAELNHGNEPALVEGCDAVIHSALDRPGSNFSGAEGDLLGFVERNVVGSLRLIESARAARVQRFVFISSCAVHDRILDDRPLDEKHPLWSSNHYGAHKAAIEKFVHSYGFGHGYPICALRPTGVYGIARRIEQTKWFDLVGAVVRGESVNCERGGKEVHAADVAKAVGVLLSADGIAGEAFNCYDRYVSQWDVANLARDLSKSNSEVVGSQTRPKHQIATDKLRALGMEFGGDELLRQTIQHLIHAVKGV